MTIHLSVIEFHESLSDKGRGIPQGAMAMRFKLVESYSTSDGIRSRLCDGLWKTKEEAVAEMQRRMVMPLQRTLEEQRRIEEEAAKRRGSSANTP